MNRLLILGHSHIEVFRRACGSLPPEQAAQISFMSLRDARYRKVYRNKVGRKSTDLDLDLVAADFMAAVKDVDAVALCLNGNEHNVIGLINLPDFSISEAIDMVCGRVRNRFQKYYGLLHFKKPRVVYLIPPPPPIKSNQYIENNPGVFHEKIKEYGVRLPSERLLIYKAQCDALRGIGCESNISMLELPQRVCSDDGFLPEQFIGNVTHGNTDYGRVVLDDILSQLQRQHLLSIGDEEHRSPCVVKVVKNKRSHPYNNLPDYAYWKTSMTEVNHSNINPMVSPVFYINKGDKVATAGSCFAQHISKRLQEYGYNFFVTEGNANVADGGICNFSARYGNIYSARQLLQLYDRAFGNFTPSERYWIGRNGRFFDPFRPSVNENGFATIDDFNRDNAEHLSCVRRLFKNLDVFIFTLGLTECWLSRDDGAAYPIAPGVVAGKFDECRHKFINYDVSDVEADLNEFINKLRAINRDCRIILTVSPVPLAATYTGNHVLAATTYSKSVLRVAAQNIVDDNCNVCYFPSYEIITGPHAGGEYFEADLRSVTESGVNHVMKIFMQHMTREENENDYPDQSFNSTLASHLSGIGQMAEVECDEELYEK